MNKNIFDIQRFATISNSANNTVITGTADADSITNSGNNVSINLVDGNDTLNNTGANVTVTSQHITLTSDALRDQLVISVDKSSSMPEVNISRGIAYGSTVSVSAGVYNVGQSVQVTVNESKGYLYLDSIGNLYAEDYSVAQVRMAREQSIATLIATLNGENTTVQAFKDFYNLYDNFPSTFTSTVAGYENGSVTSPATTVTSTGVNIYGNNALGAKPESITLQSYLSDPINIEHWEGNTDGATVKSAVIDASKGNASVIALGMNSSEEKSFASNHTIFGSDRQSTILVGDKALGDNVIKAGDGGNYIYHNGVWASIYGGAGNDTIFASKTDYVEGGGGVDYFYDTGSYKISDYNFDEDDRIVATKLSQNVNISPANINVSGNKIAVANGATLTLGSDYDGGSVSAIISNANGGFNRNYLAWAGTNSSVVDASNFSRGGLVISNNNGNISDTIVGSAYADTIYAGSGDYINSGNGNDIISLDTDHSGVSIVLGFGRDSVSNFNATNDTIIVGSTDYASKVRNGELVIYEGAASLVVAGLATDTKLEDLNILVTSTFVGGTSINNTVNNTMISGTDFRDSISNSGNQVTIQALDGNDVISNSGASVKVDGGVDSDKIYNTGSNVTINGGNGNDSIINSYSTSTASVSGFYGNYASINGGDGNDTIENYCSDVTINGDSGNDYIYNYGNNVTINGGTGDDTIMLSGGNATYQYNEGDGNDVIIGFTTSDTLVIGSTSSETFLSGNDWIFTVGENTITLQDAATLAPNKVFDNESDNISVIGTAYADIINNKGTNVTINGSAGDDTITNTGDNIVYRYAAGDGNDLIIGFTANDTLIVSSDTYRTSISGNDFIVTVVGSQNKITLKDAAGLNPIIQGESLGSVSLNINNTISNTVITGSVDADSIVNSGNNVTINALSGNDTIKNSGTDASINGGDGADYFFDNGSAEIADYNFDEGDVIVATKLSADKTLNVDDIVVYGNQIAVAGGSTITVGSSDSYDGATATKAIIANAAVENTVNVIWAGYYETKLDASTLSSGALMISKDSGYTTIFGSEYDDMIYADSYDSVKAGSGNDIISVTGYSSFGEYDDSTTVNGGAGNDTIYTASRVRDGNIYQYSAGDGNDVIIGFNSKDTLFIEGDAYHTSVSGNDLIVSIVSSQNTITLKDAANITPNIKGEKYGGYVDKEGHEIENPVAQIEVDGVIYYYESVARATNDAYNNSTVTVTANSTETSQINTTKGLTIQFEESGLGVYNVTGGNFISADSSRATEFNISSNRVLSNSNSILINNGATATIDGYAITGTSNGYSFALQDNAFIIPYTSIQDSSIKMTYLSYQGAGTATFTTSGNVSVTSGAIITYETSVLIGGSSTKHSDVEVTIAEGNYTINGVDFGVSSKNTAVILPKCVKFNLSSDTATYNSMAFNGSGTATIQSDTGILLTSGAVVSNVAAGQEFTFDGAGTFKLNNKTIISSATSLTITNTDNGLTIGENTFSVTGDDEYRINVDISGNIVSVSGIDGGSTIVNAGGADSILTSSAGNFIFAQDNNKVFNIGGDDSVTFGLTSDGAVTKIADVVGTVSGDFTNAININGNETDVWIIGDSSVTVTTESNGVSNISGLSNNATVQGTGGDWVNIITDEEGTFNFYESQHVTVTGDSSVDFILRDSVIKGVGDFESGTFSFDNTAQISVNADTLTLEFTDTATFIIANSDVVSVDGVEGYINGLTSDATVHAVDAMTVNNANINVSGDNDFNVIVSDGKTSGLANISSGASLSVAGMNVTTDNNGDFKVGEYVYSVTDSDGSITFVTNNTGSVEDIIGLNGMLKTTARNVTINGGKFTTTNTDVTISSAGANITRVDGLNSGDSIGGNLDSSTVAMPATTDTDTSVLTINERSYRLGNDSDGVLITGNRIDGLNSGASLTVGAAGSYLVNNTTLDARMGDVFIGTSEGAAYIYDPNNVPLDTSSMSDEEITSQVGITTTYNTTETDTGKTAELLASGENLNGSMELALSNSDTTTAQTADFSNSTGVKKVTLKEGTQEIKFNDEGGNVAIIESDSAGEKNVSLGGGGDLVIVKETETPVNITAGLGKDTVVTAGNNVKVNMKGGATRIVAHSGNVELSNYDAATGAGVQINAFSDIRRAVANDNINLNNGSISFGESTVVVNNTDTESTTVNLYDNKGRKQKVAYTHNDGGRLDASDEHENLLLVGNKNMDKGNSSLVSGRGNDSALGGAGDYFDLGAGYNRVYLNSNRSGAESGATVAMTTNTGRTEVYGFTSGFSETADRVYLDITKAQVSYKGGNVTFTIGSASLILNLGSSSDLADSADLIADDNFICDTRLDDITPITFEQGELYEMTFATARDTLSSNTEITFAGV